MLEYRIERQGRHSVPVVTFADPRYALAGEFLLAEARNFGEEILTVLCESLKEHKQCGFAGNAFRLEIAAEQTMIVNDITEKECVIDTKDFLDAAKEYVNNL